MNKVWRKYLFPTCVAPIESPSPNISKLLLDGRGGTAKCLTHPQAILPSLSFLGIPAECQLSILSSLEIPSNLFLRPVVVLEKNVSEKNVSDCVQVSSRVHAPINL